MCRILFRAFLLLAVSAAASAAPASALQGTVQSVAAEAWRIEGLQFDLQLTDSGLAASTRIARISLTESGERFDDIVVSCDQVALSNIAISCPAATFTADLPAIGRQTLRGSFRYYTGNGRTELVLTNVAVAGGVARVDVSVGDNEIDARFSGHDLQLAGLLQIANALGIELGDYSATGDTALSGRLQLLANGDVRVELLADFSGAAIGNASGTVATDNFGGRLELAVEQRGDDLRFDLRLVSDAGEAYVEPVYANFSEHALRLHAGPVSSNDLAHFTIAAFELQQESLLDLSGSLSLVLADDATGTASQLSGAIEIGDASVETLYSSLLQVALAGSVLGDLETAGRLSGTVMVANNSPSSAQLTLTDVALDDQQGRFAIYGLRGFVDWPGAGSDAANPSHLHWDSGLAYNIALNAATVEFRLGDDDIELLAPLRLPTMGGALLIRQLQLHDYGTAAATGLLDAELEPIQLGQLAGAFGWPAFSGTLSGRLPLLSLAEETATIGGALQARAFDGDIEMSGLRIEQPFGRVPRLYGNLQLRGLDLQRITEAFSFGLIQGRLSGDVTGLQLESWQPVAMDMHFYSTEGDKSPRRISQRAVEDLASVGGGGAAAVLSSGMLRYFEVFAYDRIGLRCVLRDGACAMSGAGSSKDSPQGQGYYIVKGKGLPRIDVVGFRNQVSWPRLVRQLVAITNSGSPTLN